MHYYFTTNVLFCVSPSTFSTGSMSSPALWASESFTQGLRSMEEVRLPRNKTPPTSSHLPKDSVTERMLIL